MNLIVVSCLVGFLLLTGCLGHWFSVWTGVHPVVSFVIALIFLSFVWRLLAAIANSAERGQSEARARKERKVSER